MVSPGPQPLHPLLEPEVGERGCLHPTSALPLWSLLPTLLILVAWASSSAVARPTQEEGEAS